MTYEELTENLNILGYKKVSNGYELGNIFVIAYIWDSIECVDVKTHQNIEYRIDYEEFHNYMIQQANIHYALNAKQIKGE